MTQPSKKTKRDVSLARVLSKLGYSSRSQAIRLIEQGLVKVNGRITRHSSFRCSIEHDRIIVEGKSIGAKKRVYIAFHKPTGLVTTRSDERGRKTIYDIIGKMDKWMFPVGRLDKDTSGLLILTNDTVFGNKLTNPDNHVPKTYVVTIDKPLSKLHAEMMQKGMMLGDEQLQPAKVTNVRQSADGNVFELTIFEGKNRQIRRMCETMGYVVLSLHRLRIGSYSIGSLKAGEWNYISEEKIHLLLRNK